MIPEETVENLIKRVVKKKNPKYQKLLDFVATETNGKPHFHTKEFNLYLCSKQSIF